MNEILVCTLDATDETPAVHYTDWLEEILISDLTVNYTESGAWVDPYGPRARGWRSALSLCARAEIYPNEDRDPCFSMSPADEIEGFAEARNWYEENKDRFQIKIRNRSERSPYDR